MRLEKRRRVKGRWKTRKMRKEKVGEENQQQGNGGMWKKHGVDR